MKSKHKNWVWPLSFCVLLASVAWSQPSKVPPTAVQQAEQAVTKQVLQEFAALRQQSQELEHKDAQVAIATYQKFYEDKAYKYRGAGLEIASLIARLYYVELRDKVKALEIYDWAIEQFKGVAGYEKLWQEREQVKHGTLSPAAVKIETAPNTPKAAPETVKPPAQNAPSTLWGNGLKPVQIAPAPWQKWNKAPENATLPAVTLPNASLPPVTLPPVVLEAPFGEIAPAVPVGEGALQQAILTQLKSGALTAEQAWTNYNLNADIALRWINSQSLRWPDDATLANALIEQVNQKAPEKLRRESLQKLPPENRVRIGDYFSGQRDERAIAIYQDVMNEPARNGTVPDWYGQAGARLGAFYEAKGENQKALAAYLDVVEKLPKNGGYGVYALIDAARLSEVFGQKDKAKHLYQRVSDYKVEYLSALVLSKAANCWSDAELNEKRTFWKSRLENSSFSERIVALYLLGKSHYYQAEWRDASNYFEKIMALSQQGLISGQYAWLGSISIECEQFLNLSRQWLKQPLVCDPPALIVELPDQKVTSPVTRSIFISSPRPVSLTANAKLTGLLVSVADDFRSSGSKYIAKQIEREIVLSFEPKLLEQESEGSVVIRSAELPDFQLYVPLRIVRRTLPLGR